MGTKVVKFRSNKVSVASQGAVHVEMQDNMPHSADSVKKVDELDSRKLAKRQMKLNLLKKDEYYLMSST